jgi:peptidoglycan/xylan/chitin deacetylase (PgdA/CDA1 family)
LKNAVLNNLHTFGVSSFLRSRKAGQLTVLSLHRISDERNTFWNPIKPKTFDKLLQYVKKHYEVIGFQELLEDHPTKRSKPLLILSFDDGYYDFYEYALPLLKKHDLPSNHNIVYECAENNQTIWTEKLNVIFEFFLKGSENVEIDFGNRKSKRNEFDSWMAFYLNTFKTLLDLPTSERENVLNQLSHKAEVDTQQQMMNWDQIKECASNRVEIGSHSYTHDSIGTIMDSEDLKKEINDSRTAIESKLGTEISIFALPNGQTGPKADALISASDHKFVLYANDELNRMPLASEQTPIQISRINLVDEPFPQMALRLEQFHKLMRKYV